VGLGGKTLLLCLFLTKILRRARNRHGLRAKYSFGRNGIGIASPRARPAAWCRECETVASLVADLRYLAICARVVCSNRARMRLNKWVRVCRSAWQELIREVEQRKTDYRFGAVRAPTPF